VRHAGEDGAAGTTRPDGGADRDRVRASLAGIDAALAELRGLAAGSDLVGDRTGARGPAADDVAVGLATDYAGDVIAVLDADGRYDWVSRSSLLVSGWAPDQVVGCSVFDLVHPDDLTLMQDLWRRLAEGSPLDSVEYRRRRPDGSHHWVETRIRALRDPEGRLTGAVASIRDVEDRRRLQQDLADALEVFELSFIAAPIGKALTGPDGRWLKVNPALAAIVGRSEEELLAGSYQDITHPDDLLADRHLVDEVVRGERNGFELEKRYLRPDGSVVWVQVSVAAVRRADGGIRFFVTQVQDIDRRKAGEEALQHRADHDPLTGLWNRRRFTEELGASARDRRAADRQVLLLADLDGFKAVNDRHGHATGDAHLREVAAVLRSTVRVGDACARLGGDEFAVLLHDADPRTAADIAERIAHRIAELRHGHGVSVGIAERNSHQDVDGWLDAADRAMYAVKSRSRRSAR
jgi:diguanylate cyclase (GGDEF)-like protein/PAS domain S-box-containing protein